MAEKNGRGRRERVPAGSGGTDYRFPASTKVYVQGSIHPDIRVPMREIRLTPTASQNGGPAEANPPLHVYDTSGPSTDPKATIDIRQGLPCLREPWIRARTRCEEAEPSYRPVRGQSDPTLPM